MRTCQFSNSNQILTYKVAYTFLCVLVISATVLVSFLQNVAKADWTMGRGDLASTGSSQSELPEKLELLWERELGGIGFESTPIIAEQTVFIGDPDGNLVAIKVDDGEIKWQRKFETGFIAAASYLDGTIYIGDYDGKVYSLNAKDGSEKWTHKSEMQIDAGPTFVGENLLFTSQDGKLYCLERESGKLVWQYETGDQLRCGPTLAGNRTYLGGCDGKLHVVDVITGKAIGEPIPLDGPTGSTPSVADETVFVPTYGGRIFAFDVASSSKKWEFADQKLAQEFQSSVAVKGNLIIASSRNKHLFAVDASNGKVVWDQVLRKRSDGSPVIAGSSVIVSAADGRLIVFDLKSGSQKWQYEIKGGFIGSPAVSDQKIVVASDKGTVFCFGGKVR